MNGFFVSANFVNPDFVLFRAPLSENSPLRAEFVPKNQDKTVKSNIKSKYITYGILNIFALE